MNMKRVFCAVLAMALFLCGFFGCTPQPEEPGESNAFVPLSGSVYMVDASAVTEGGEILFEDERGHLWAWPLGENDLPVNDHVILVLHDNNTPAEITDDIIIEWR